MSGRENYITKFRGKADVDIKEMLYKMMQIFSFLFPPTGTPRCYKTEVESLLTQQVFALSSGLAYVDWNLSNN